MGNKGHSRDAIEANEIIEIDLDSRQCECGGEIGIIAPRNSCECPYRHQIMPVIFPMIYMCGLRPSEARLLRVSDVDL